MLFHSFLSARCSSLRVALLAVSLVCGISQTPADDWHQWRGPTRDGHIAGAPWPKSLSTNHLKPSWRVELGPSYSGPILHGNKVFTTETSAKKYEIVRAFDRTTGKELWKSQWEGAISVPFFAKSNGDWIRSTPACDGESLYVAGIRDVLVALDTTDGKERWRFDFVQKLGAPLPEFGFVCSPLVDGDAIYVQAGASFVKLNKKSGELIWRSLNDKGGMWGNAFSSPGLVSIAGKRQLVVQTREKIAGVDPESGSVLWDQPVEAFRGMNILTPVVHKDMLFTSTYGGKTIGFKITNSGSSYSLAQAWTHKAQGYMSTPVVIEGVAYNFLKSQRFMAIEVETGRELWTSDKSFGKYWSLVAQGDRILALDQTGRLYLIRANKSEFELIDQRKLTDEETWAHLAVADSQLFVRELRALTAYQWSN